MTFSSLSFTQRASAGEGFEVGEIRALIAKRLGIDVRRVTDEAHFSDDLGADWLDRLELLILIEDQFPAWKSWTVMPIRLNALAISSATLKLRGSDRCRGVVGSLPVVSDPHDVTEV